MNPSSLSVPLQVRGSYMQGFIWLSILQAKCTPNHIQKEGPLLFALSNAIRLFILKISKSCREIERVSILFYQQEMSNISFLNQKSKRYKKTGYRSLCLITITLRLLKRMHFTMCCFLIIETVCLILQRNDPAVFWLNTQRSDSWFHGLKSHHCCSGD